MSTNFIPTDRKTLFLLPPSVDDWVPEGHLARFVVDIVDQLDLRWISSAYGGKGSKAYHPSTMLALLFYGYATGVFSSRKIERATWDSVAFRFIAANQHPDHATIANFRRRFLRQLKPLFMQILLIAKEMGLLHLGKVSLDGTKVKANASKHRALSWDYAKRLERQLKKEVTALLDKAEVADRANIPDGMDLPEEITRREKRLKAIADAKAKIAQRAEERYKEEQDTHDQKMAEREKQEKESGKKPRGPKPKPPQPGPGKSDQVNLTDEESRVMPKSGGGFEQAYNAQAGVDTETMLVVTSHVSQAPNDKQEIVPALDNLAALPKELGKVDTLLADCGYFSADNVTYCNGKKITPYIAHKREQHNQSLWDRFSEPPPLPEDSDAVETMKHRLRTSSGRKLYGKRKSTVEPVFGIIKSVMGFRQFMLRGLKAASGEWDLVCIAWNLKRLHVLGA